MSPSKAFSQDYATARRRFRDAAAALGWQLESHSIGSLGPDGEELTIDVGCSPDAAPQKVLVLSSGVHGVEGFFGSAVQLALLQHWASTGPPPVKCVFLHGLNPFGFAWLRRFNEDNVDINRNFLLPAEKYEGSPAGYAGLDGLLNPRRPPSRWEPFTLKALWAIARHGMVQLQNTVAAGQYEFPKGLFFGGAGPVRTHQLLAENFARWLQGSEQVVHFDFHTGLGPMGEYKLLLDYPLSPQQHARMTDWFGADAFEACDSGEIAYDARGGFGQWCVSHGFAPDYLFACAEFGTYAPVKILKGLRAENQAFQWAERSGAAHLRAGQRLKELFGPSDKTWRSQVVGQSLDLVDRAIHGLMAPFCAK